LSIVSPERKGKIDTLDKSGKSGFSGISGALLLLTDSRAFSMMEKERRMAAREGERSR